MVAMINAQLGAGFRIFIGVAELLAVVGLILPGVTRILPVLTAVAAAGLMLVMGSATVFHVFRGESESAITTAVLFVLVTVVAYTRWKVAPIAPRQRA
jgi:putative oxidoreductase